MVEFFSLLAFIFANFVADGLVLPLPGSGVGSVRGRASAAAELPNDSPYLFLQIVGIALTFALQNQPGQVLYRCVWKRSIGYV